MGAGQHRRGVRSGDHYCNGSVVGACRDDGRRLGSNVGACHRRWLGGHDGDGGIDRLCRGRHRPEHNLPAGERTRRSAENVARLQREFGIPDGAVVVWKENPQGMRMRETTWVDRSVGRAFMQVTWHDALGYPVASDFGEQSEVERKQQVVGDDYRVVAQQMLAEAAAGKDPIALRDLQREKEELQEARDRDWAAVTVRPKPTGERNPSARLALAPAPCRLHLRRSPSHHPWCNDHGRRSTRLRRRARPHLLRRQSRSPTDGKAPASPT